MRHDSFLYNCLNKQVSLKKPDSMNKDEGLNINLGKLADSDVEEDELVQDWSVAAQLSARSSTLPKRGEKDYEPDGTDVQELLLDRARKAMFDTLSNSPRGSVVKNLIKAYYDPNERKAVVLKPKGNFLHTLGKMDSHGKIWLELYEFVYLAERGTVTPFYKVDGMDWINQELPLTIEELYMFFKSQQELDQFFVFAYLKRLGFIVMSTKHCSNSFFPPEDRNNAMKKEVFSNTWNLLPEWRKKLHNAIFYSPWRFCLYRYSSISQIYQSLNQLVPSQRPPRTEKELSARRMTMSTSPISSPISLNVWKPRSDFKKKNPGPPDYQVVIYNKNDPNQHFPTYQELQDIFQHLDSKSIFLTENYNTRNQMDYSSSRGKSENGTADVLKSKCTSSVNDKMTNSKTKSYQEKMKWKQKHGPKSPRALQKIRLKNGFQNFLLAIMDDGMISFVKISETDFGSENVWYVPTSRKKANSRD